MQLKKKLFLFIFIFIITPYLAKGNGRVWEFDHKQDLLDWETTWNLLAPYLWDGCFYSETLERNAGMLSPPGLNLQAEDVNCVYLRIKLNQSNARIGAALLFALAPEERFSSEQTVEFRLIADNNFHVYELNVSEHPAWKGVIGRLRLNFHGAQVKFAVDYLRVGARLTSSQNTKWSMNEVKKKWLRSSTTSHLARELGFISPERLHIFAKSYPGLFLRYDCTELDSQDALPNAKMKLKAPDGEWFQLTHPFKLKAGTNQAQLIHLHSETLPLKFIEQVVIDVTSPESYELHLKEVRFLTWPAYLKKRWLLVGITILAMLALLAILGWSFKKAWLLLAKKVRIPTRKLTWLCLSLWVIGLAPTLYKEGFLMKNAFSYWFKLTHEQKVKARWEGLLGYDDNYELYETIKRLTPEDSQIIAYRTPEQGLRLITLIYALYPRSVYDPLGHRWKPDLDRGDILLKGFDYIVLLGEDAVPSDIERSYLTAVAKGCYLIKVDEFYVDAP